jgi:hypothetical protein
MGEPNFEETPQPIVRTPQIIVCVLAAGVFSFAIVAAVIRSQSPAPIANGPLVISFVGLALTAFALLASAFLIPIIAKTQRKTATNFTATQLVSKFTTRTIVGAAFLEGAAFCLLLGYLIEGQSWNLAIAVALGLLILVPGFPTRARVVSTVQEDWKAIQEGRAEA